MHVLPRPGATRLAPALVLIAGVILIGGATPSGVGSATTAREDARAEPILALAALPLLRAAISAERRMAYAGTLSEQFPGRTAILASLRHRAGASTVSLAVGAGPASAAPPLLTSAALALLAAHYRLVMRGTGSVAGRLSYLVAAQRPGGTAAARFWIDEATLLPLRADVFDDRGQEVSATGFVRLDDLGGATMTTIAADRRAASPLMVDAAVPEAQLGALPRATLPAGLAVPGWDSPGRLWPHMSLISAQRTTLPSGWLVHLTYSDGAFSLSLFVQPGVLSTPDVRSWTRSRIAGTVVWTQRGALQRTAWQDGAYVITVLTDAPQAGGDALVATAVHRLSVPARAPSLTERLRRGLDRVGSWFDPFH